jgi:hypothetical protein
MKVVIFNFDVNKIENEIDQAVNNIITESNSVANLAIEGYRSLKLSFDLRFAISMLNKAFTDKTEVQRYLSELKKTLTNVDSIVKSYLKIKDQKNVIWPISDIKTETCYGAPLKRFVMYLDSLGQTKILNNKLETDVLIIVRVRKTDDKILASAGPCIVKNNRTIIGMMEINITNMTFSEKRTHFDKYSDTMTLLHELFHALAFNAGIYNKLSFDLKNINNPNNRLKDTSRFNYLNKMQYIPGQDPLLDNEHWNQSYIPNDLMIPIERIDTLLTIFTLEYIEYVSIYDEIKVFRENLQHNYLASEIKDYQEFFRYKCNDKQPSIYPSFCSNAERMKIKSGCDSTYMFKAKCGGTKLQNNCYERISNKYENCIAKSDPSSGVSVKNFEKRGDTSRCFETPDQKASYCLRVNIENGIIKVMLPNDTFVSCTFSESGKPMKFSYDDGKGKKNDFEILCPDIKRFTDYYNKMSCPDMCFGNGFCSNGECKCFEGYDPFTNCKTFSPKNTAETKFLL